MRTVEKTVKREWTRPELAKLGDIKDIGGKPTPLLQTGGTKS